MKVLCTLRKTSICRRWGIHAKYRWLCLLYYIMDLLSGNPHLHLTTKYKFLQSVFLRSFSTSRFLQGQSGHRVCGPFPHKDPACCFPAEVWHEEVRPQETLSLLVPAQQKVSEWHMSCGGGWTWNVKRAKACVFQNIHTQWHSCLPFTNLIQCPL